AGPSVCAVTGQGSQQGAAAEITALPGEPADALVEVATAVLGSGQHRVVQLTDVLEGTATASVDVVRAEDDLLPRLAHENVLGTALDAARLALRPGGLL